MKHVHNLFAVAVLLLCTSGLFAQLTVSGNTVLTLTDGTVVTATGLGLEIHADATVHSQGEFYTDGIIANNGTISTRINGPTPGQDYGYFATESDLELNGNLLVTQAADYTPAEDAVHPLMLGAARNGTFASSDLPSADWQLVYTATEVNLLFDALVSTDDFSDQDVTLLVYPNPTSNFLYLQATYQEGQNLEVFDALGRRVLRQFPTREVETAWRIELPAQLANGTYFLKYGGLQQRFQYLR